MLESPARTTLTVAQRARQLNVSEQTVRRYWPELGGFHVGRQLRFPEDFPAPTLPMTQRGHSPAKNRIRND